MRNSFTHLFDFGKGNIVVDRKGYDDSVRQETGNIDQVVWRGMIPKIIEELRWNGNHFVFRDADLCHSIIFPVFPDRHFYPDGCGWIFSREFLLIHLFTHCTHDILTATKAHMSLWELEESHMTIQRNLIHIGYTVFVSIH